MKSANVCYIALCAASLGAAAPTCNGDACTRDDPTGAGAPALCGNAGLQWAYFYDTSPYSASNMDPTLHKSDQPQSSGVTNYLHFLLYGDYYLYDNKKPGLDLDHAIVEHRGYIFTPETGIYTFQASNIDDGWMVWLGSLAYSGWTKGNQVQSAYWNGQSGSSTYTTKLDAGKYYAFRAVGRNSGGPGSWDYNITAPSGNVILHNDPKKAKDSPYVVQKSCDGVLGPAYPPWGQET